MDAEPPPPAGRRAGRGRWPELGPRSRPARARLPAPLHRPSRGGGPPPLPRPAARRGRRDARRPRRDGPIPSAVMRCAGCARPSRPTPDRRRGRLPDEHRSRRHPHRSGVAGGRRDGAPGPRPSVLDQLPATHQRRARWPAWRLNTMTTFRPPPLRPASASSRSSSGSRPGPPARGARTRPRALLRRDTPVLPPTACPPGRPCQAARSRRLPVALPAWRPTVALPSPGLWPATQVPSPSTRRMPSTSATYPRLEVRRIAPDGVITHRRRDRQSSGTRRRRSLPPQRPSKHQEVSSLDAAGNLYVADLREILSGKSIRPGIISTYAGIGLLRPQAAMTDRPRAPTVNAGQLSIGPDGSLYLDDSNNFRTIAPDGTIRAFAGTGVSGYSGDGGPALARDPRRG